MDNNLALSEFSWIDEQEKILHSNQINIDKLLESKNPYAQEFDLSMGRKGHIYFGNQFRTERNCKRYFFCRDLFIKNNPEIVSEAVTAKIPKIIHHIWIGEKPIPDYFAAYQASWKKFHPDWQLKLWTDKEVEAENFFTKDLWKYCCNIAQKADIIRYEILYRWGGLYTDTDFECLANFDRLAHQYDFFAGILPEYPPRIGVFKRKVATPTLQIMNALIGAKPGHPILEKTINNIRERLPMIAASKRYNGLNYIWQGESIKVVLSTMMSFRDAVFFCADTPLERNIVLPSTYFYPILPQHAISDGKRISTDFISLKEESMANHHYAASWSNSKGKKVRTVLTKLKALKLNFS
ncbi:glycosyltransferase family 32 protein [Legionella septentrionalis]|uniref:glycosyltransferase family 32 protein n=1 Tax=Legionella septentrionalis TaxID=2498109 RepID=UPI000F8CB2CB|nr:glycosyltransferase [Legionella septentrionalis]RUQ94632.1 hypothetical protein ELY11_10880 [Legionella septentrionalis]